MNKNKITKQKKCMHWKSTPATETENWANIDTAPAGTAVDYSGGHN